MSLEEEHTVALPETIASPRAKLVYLYLSMAGAATVRELQEALNETLLCLYQILRTLAQRGMIEQVGGTYVCVEA